MLQSFRSGLTPEFAVDLGAAHTLVYQRGKGVIANEASHVAIRGKGSPGDPVVAFGNKAKALAGRTSSQIKNSRPLFGGRVEDAALAETFLRHLLSSVPTRKRMVGSEVLIGLPAGMSRIERHAVLHAFKAASGGRVWTISEAIAAALGAGIPVDESCGTMIIDVGGGTTDIAVVSLNGVVVSASCKTAGDYFDFLIADYVRRTKAIAIGETTAEQIKLSVGGIGEASDERQVVVQGQGLKTGMPANVTVSEHDVSAALTDSISEIVDLVLSVLDRTPPEIASDLMDTGALLVGGGALLGNLDVFLSERTGLPITVVEAPETAVISGFGRILEDWQKYKHLLRNH